MTDMSALSHSENNFNIILPPATTFHNSPFPFTFPDKMYTFFIAMKSVIFSAHGHYPWFYRFYEHRRNILHPSSVPKRPYLPATPQGLSTLKTNTEYPKNCHTHSEQENLFCLCIVQYQLFPSATHHSIHCARLWATHFLIRKLNFLQRNRK